MLGLSSCSGAVASNVPDVCQSYMEPALGAVNGCLEKMEKLIAPNLPKDVDTVSVDIFNEGFDLGFSHRRLVRHGGNSNDLRMYLVCMVGFDESVITGHFYTYDHWPPSNVLLYFMRSDGRYIEQFFGLPHVPAFSEEDLDSGPLASIIFERDDDDFLFSKCFEETESVEER